MVHADDEIGGLYAKSWEAAGNLDNVSWVRAFFFLRGYLRVIIAYKRAPEGVNMVRGKKGCEFSIVLCACGFRAQSMSSRLLFHCRIVSHGISNFEYDVVFPRGTFQFCKRCEECRCSSSGENLESSSSAVTIEIIRVLRGNFVRR